MTHITVDVDGAVGTITIERPKRFNSLDVETARDLRKAGLQLARDPDIRAVVLRGSGGVFSSGADLKEVAGCQLPVACDFRRPATGNGQQATYGAVFKQILEYIHS